MTSNEIAVVRSAIKVNLQNQFDVKFNGKMFICSWMVDGYTGFQDIWGSYYIHGCDVTLVTLETQCHNVMLGSI